LENTAVASYKPERLFIDRNNTIYVIDSLTYSVYDWHEGDINVTRAMFDNLNKPASLFVTIDGDIYVDNGKNGAVEKLTLHATESVAVMTVSSSCTGLFVDITNNLYCSLRDDHRVVKQSLNVTAHVTTVVAGTGSRGSTSNMLSGPAGIFVDTHFNLYVADCANHRIQRFAFGQLYGTTVAGNADLSITELRCPEAVFLDADGYLFIVDSGHSRIVKSSSNGLHCVVGCSGVRDRASHQLNLPNAAAFDSHGNIFVADTFNRRIQKFILMGNAFGK
jgi:hypothetical protein